MPGEPVRGGEPGFFGEASGHGRGEGKKILHGIDGSSL
jgi:hypothetical protein